MRHHLALFVVASLAVFASALTSAQMKPWNNAGLAPGVPDTPYADTHTRDARQAAIKG